jgi:hypothetical protein
MQKTRAVSSGLWLLAAAAATSWSMGYGPDSSRKTEARPLRREAFYEARYQLADVLQKLTDDHGDGFEGLYGTRNLRFVLQGILYRGGSNNLYHKVHRRENKNQLPEDGLYNLCREGFSEAIYLYPTHFTGEREIRCKPRVSVSHSAINTLRYRQLSPHSTKQLREILGDIYEHIVDPKRGPLYAHCWNGWHSSGMAAAIALRQFCGVGPDEAVKYWELGTDGVDKDPDYEEIREKIRSFEPVPELLISTERQKLICPNFRGQFVLSSRQGRRLHSGK